MNTNVSDVIKSIDRVSAKDLDECSVFQFTQLYHFLNKHVGDIFIKTVGRMADTCDHRQELRGYKCKD